MTAHLLFEQVGWRVHAIVRKNSLNLPLLDYLKSRSNGRLVLHYGDVTDAFFVFGIIRLIKPDHVYNFAA
jgi:GDPmannose 4,6-dehydratase